MDLIKTLLSAAGKELTVEDVFSTYLYTGTGAALDIVNGIDLDGNDGMVWIKNRDAADTHVIVDTIRGVGETLTSETTAAEATNADTVTALNANGFSLGADVLVNTSTENYASWIFRKSPRFFDQAQATVSTGNATVSFPSLGTLGMVIIKRTDDTGSWYVWHKDLTAGKLLYLDTNDRDAVLGHMTVSGTTVTLVYGVIADGTYIVYGFAHDTEDDGMIQCGTYTGTGTTANPVELGWEAQYVLIKNTNQDTNWTIWDTMRGMPVDPTFNGTAMYAKSLYPNTTGAEATAYTMHPHATGFIVNDNSSEVNQVSIPYIYMAIRRPMETPTEASEVFAIDQGDAVSNPNFTAGFPIDMGLMADTTGAIPRLASRLNAGAFLGTSETNAESANNVYDLDSMTSWYKNVAGVAWYSCMWKRAKGFFDVVCYAGTGAAHTETHNLGVVPEMIWVKNRDQADAWAVYCGDETGYLVLNTDAGTADLNTYWNDTPPTNSVFTVGTADSVNISEEAYITYLFATLQGISKVGSYTGNGTTQTIDCGFSAGSSFILIKRTDDTGDWTFFDKERGIITGDTPYLILNDTDAQVTNEDVIDPATSGFIVNETTAALNTNAAEYIFYAIAAID